MKTSIKSRCYKFITAVCLLAGMILMTACAFPGFATPTITPTLTL